MENQQFSTLNQPLPVLLLLLLLLWTIKLVAWYFDFSLSTSKRLSLLHFRVNATVYSFTMAIHYSQSAAQIKTLLLSFEPSIEIEKIKTEPKISYKPFGNISNLIVYYTLDWIKMVVLCYEHIETARSFWTTLSGFSFSLIV